MVHFYDRLVGKIYNRPMDGSWVKRPKNCHPQQLLRLISTSYRRSWVHCFRPRSLKCLWQKKVNETPSRYTYTLKDERLEPTAITHLIERTLTFPKPSNEDMGSPSLCHLSGFRGFWVLILPEFLTS